jgi:hypothetical protein
MGGDLSHPLLPAHQFCTGHVAGHGSPLATTVPLTYPPCLLLSPWRLQVLPCSKRYAHDWRACPFAHPTENARRRDPREVMYSSIACPDYKQGFCIRGDTCQYAHGVFESWLHPSR